MSQIGSINLMVRDIAAVEQFYTDVLGLVVDQDRTNRPSFVLLRAGSTLLTLQDANSMGQLPEAGNAIEIGFEVNDVESVRRKLGDRAIVQSMGWGNAIETADPNGTRLNIYQWEKPADRRD
ncbi:VOC family protein [Acidobacteria bacterium AB60]|nr:VOC family protein [Acidobacteria bacterium AB60]